MAAAPGLERWKLNQLMMAALTMPAIEGESLTDYEARLWEDANAHDKDAREKGTKIHGHIEGFYENMSHQDSPYVAAAVECLYAAFGGQADGWNPEKSFASTLGFGGKVDLFSEDIIIDYKTKDFTADTMKKPFAYPENKMQLAAYRKGLAEQGLCKPDAIMANLYIARELQEDGTALAKLEIHEDDYWPHFECLLNYWKLIKNVK
jgi:hypothetical protein